MKQKDNGDVQMKPWGRLDHHLLEYFIGKWNNEQAIREEVYKLIEEENVLFDAPLVFNK
ncbi:hypothetical protein [Limosilactobacillus reuteri]|uniref:hypothetical protein n=1 Tax=Limosilactobacillus reuteri TaxID=1598 RepID=UPI001E46E67B|nr:hypothetical protein [Limosilactobacillus reuteri]MCC4486251.1 hypothetical protein [Limosilactobacillus reuteri]